MPTIFLRSVACLVAFAACPAWGAETSRLPPLGIPAHLIGCWSSEDGTKAFFVGADGLGALVGGSPPIGLPIKARFDPKTNQLEYDLFNHGKIIETGRLFHDPKRKVLFSKEGPLGELTRQAPQYTAQHRRGIFGVAELTPEIKRELYGK